MRALHPEPRGTPSWTKLTQGEPRSPRTRQGAYESAQESTNVFSHWTCLLLILSKNAREKDQGKPSIAPSALVQDREQMKEQFSATGYSMHQDAPHQPATIPSSSQEKGKDKEKQNHPIVFHLSCLGIRVFWL